MGGPIDIEQKGCESTIHDHEHDLCVTMVGWVDVPDSDRGDFRCQCAVDISSFQWPGVWAGEYVPYVSNKLSMPRYTVVRHTGSSISSCLSITILHWRSPPISRLLSPKVLLIPYSLFYVCSVMDSFCIYRLTHWGQEKVAAILQTTFWTSFPWLKMDGFCLRFHWNMFLGLELTVFQYWFR